MTGHRSLLRALLACGLLSSAVYVVSDIVGALSYPAYDFKAQAISEMSATGAPTSQLLAPFYLAFSLLFVAFTIGVWLTGASKPRLRWSAGLMLGVAALGAGLSLFPMSVRGMERTTSDSMHLLFGAATMMLLSAAILTGGAAFSRSFRRYSATSALVMLVFFILTLFDAPKLAADLPTPFMGLNERISMAAWLLWVAVLSVKLMRAVGQLERAAAQARRVPRSAQGRGAQPALAIASDEATDSCRRNQPGPPGGPM